MKEPAVVAIQGVKGAYSECAALDFFGGAEILECKDYADLFSALASGRANRLVIPIENSSAGSVYPYYDLLLEYATEHGFRICGELKLRIRHNLVALDFVELADIKGAVPLPGVGPMPEVPRWK